MKRVAGQAARVGGHAARLSIGLAFLLLLALAALAFRLYSAPLPLGVLAEMIEDRVNADPARRLDVRVGAATLAWAGFREGHRSPLELRLEGLRATDLDGRVAVEVPDVALSLSIPALLRGALEARQIELKEPALLLVREADGRLRLDLGMVGVADEEADAGGEAAASALLGELFRPPGGSGFTADLRQLRIEGGRATVRDLALGVTWRMELRRLALLRGEAGGVSGEGAGRLLLPGGAVPVTLSGDASEAGGQFVIETTGFAPPALAPIHPALAPLAGIEAEARLRFDGAVSAEGRLARLSATLGLGPGQVTAGEARLAIAGASLTLGLSAERLRLEPSTLRLARGPVVSAEGAAERGEGGWAGELRLGLDRLAVADLAALWPEAALPDARAWIVPNITAGVARDGAWRVGFRTAPGFAAPEVTALDGRLAVEGATVHWLRPIPPLEAVHGTIRFAPTAITIDVAGARQQGSAIQVRGGRVAITGLDGPVDEARIEADVAGPLPDVLALTAHPRLNLFRNRPLDLVEPGGRLEGRLEIGFPLLAELPIGDVRIRAEARIAEGRLGNAVLGQPLEGAALTLTVTEDEMRIEGTGRVAEVPLRLAFEADFRRGNANQVIERVRAEGRADWARLAALGIAPPGEAEGSLALTLGFERRRNGQGVVALRGDLRDSRFALPQAGWSKARGSAGSLEASLRLQGNELTAIEGLRAEAPGLSLRGRAGFARGGRLQRVQIAQGSLGQSRFSGEVTAPAQPGGAWVVAINGAVLDAGPLLARDDRPTPARATPEPAPTRLEWQARFDRVLLGGGRSFHETQLRLRGDSRGRIDEGRISGRAAPQSGAFAFNITPRDGGRDLSGEAEDAGALLAGLDVLRSMRGGRLSLRGRWATRDAPLAGEATIEEFSIVDAPALGKLLQAITVFGIIDALRSEGLAFARLVAPFELTPERLTLGQSRAFSASLGITAQGSIDRAARSIAMEGTVVPAYVLNTALGRIPLIGRVFSAERGGGLVAVSWRMTGPIADPNVTVNPLSALTPGFLRGLFGAGP